MHAVAHTPSRPRRLAANALTGIVALFLLLDGAMKLIQPQVVIDTTTLQLGYPHGAIAGPEGAVVIDVCSPIRDDWNNLPIIERRPYWPR